VVSEDHSPRCAEIEATVTAFSQRYPDIHVRYYSNAENMGYDANLRSLLDKARGEYVFFMGDDDRVPPGAIGKVLAALDHERIGVVLRAWHSFDGGTQEVLDTHHYFDGDRLFSSGARTVAAFFRRSVFISGLTVNRRAAQVIHTEMFDGLLLYQLYLVGKLLQEMNGYYLDAVIAERRVGGEHFFGSSRREAGRFEPNKLDIHHSVRFLAGLFQIAEYLGQQDRGNPERYQAGSWPVLISDAGDTGCAAASVDLCTLRIQACAAGSGARPIFLALLCRPVGAWTSCLQMDDCSSSRHAWLNSCPHRFLRCSGSKPYRLNG